MRINITIPDGLHKEIQKYKKGVMQINVSKICTEAIKKELNNLKER